MELKGGAGDPLTNVLTTDIGDAEITEDDSGQADDAPPETGARRWIPWSDPSGRLAVAASDSASEPTDYITRT